MSGKVQVLNELRLCVVTVALCKAVMQHDAIRKLYIQV